MKHVVDAQESSNVLVSIIMDLPYLNMIGNKKQGVGYEGKLGPFWTQDVSESSLEVLLRLNHYYKMWVQFISPRSLN